MAGGDGVTPARAEAAWFRAHDFGRELHDAADHAGAAVASLDDPQASGASPLRHAARLLRAAAELSRKEKRRDARRLVRLAAAAVRRVPRPTPKTQRAGTQRHLAAEVVRLACSGPEIRCTPGVDRAAWFVALWRALEALHAICDPKRRQGAIEAGDAALAELCRRDARRRASRA